MSRSGLLFASALLLASTSGQVWAANAPELSEVAGKYTVTPSSRIAFSVAQVGGGGIKGVFGKFSGSFTLETGDLQHSTVSFTLVPDSVVAGEKRIDTFLKSTAVFDAANFNAITFRSNAIKQTGPDTATVTGQLSAKGHQRSESFNVKLTRWNGKSIAFDVSGDVFRSRYDMDVGTPIYSNVVHFDMSVEGERR